jgi:hypothetical protein
MRDKKHPFESDYSVALYRDLQHNMLSVWEFYGEKDSNYHSGDVRISEPVRLRFEPLKNDDVIRNAIHTIDAQEQQLRLELEKRLAELREMKKQLLAITYQPAEPAEPAAPSAEVA